MNWKNRFSKLGLSSGAKRRAGAVDNPTQERLARAFSRLQDIQKARASRHDLSLERAVEERLIWRELLDLELQDADEKIQRRAEAASGVTG